MATPTIKLRCPKYSVSDLECSKAKRTKIQDNLFYDLGKEKSGCRADPFPFGRDLVAGQQVDAVANEGHDSVEETFSFQ